MKSSKILGYVVVMFFIFSTCEGKQDVNDNSIQFYYDKCNHMLLICNFESARYIKKIELDLKHDTLSIGKISRKLIPFFRKRNSWIMIECSVKLQPTVKAITYRDRFFNLSEIEEYSHKELMNKRYAVITFFPNEFPCVIP